MAIISIQRSWGILSRFFSDENLTRKAYLNTLHGALEYASQLAVGFIITPLVVAGLGSYFYGAWQVMNRLVSFISPASGNPNEALKWILASQQASTDYEEKRRHVGSALAACAVFLPIIVVAGGIVAWFVPSWLEAPPESFWLLRATAALLVLNLVITMLSGLPQSILLGENIGYKRMGLTALLAFVAGGFTWSALRLGTGIIGVAGAALTSSVLTGVVLLTVTRTFTPWIGIARPSLQAVRRFLGLSGWFMAWDVIAILMLASDVVVLGLLHSVESVTSFTLTKYAPEMLISAISVIVTGITPGLGGIIGGGDLKKASQVRSETMALTWLALTALETCILLWNRPFIGLWVGPEHFAGAIPNLMIVLVVTQLVLIRTDASIIDLTLRLERKVVIGGLSVALSLALAGVLVGHFRLGIVGLCFGLLIGRSVLSFGYPTLVGRFLGVPLSSQIKGVLRPALVTVLFFTLTATLECLAPWPALSGLKGWLIFALSAGVSGVVLTYVMFRAGLSRDQRQTIIMRVRMLISAASRSTNES